MPIKILVSDKIAEEGLAALREYPDIEVVVKTNLSKDELIQEIPEYDGLVIRSSTQVTADVIAAAKKLKAIARAGVGVDNIDLTAATKKGILVINSPDGNTLAAAEHSIAMLMALVRHIPQAHHSLAHEGQWQRNKYMGVQVAGKVLGVIGLGRIGTEVAKRAQGMEMKVLGYDPFIQEERARKLKIELSDVDDICQRADFISVHTPLTKQTAGLIGKEQFKLMKPGMRIVNCARGGIIDEEALYEAIQQGVVAGAALDVFCQEPPTNSPLLTLPQVIATPHLGASTSEAQVNVAIDVAHNIIKAIKHREYHNLVNAPGLNGDYNAIGPYMNIAERLGRLFTEFFGGGYTKMELICAGEAAKLDTSALRSVVLKGLLDPIMQGDVNWINAPVYAEERGLSLSETKEYQAADFPNLITLRGKGPEREVYVSGTVASGNAPTLVDIDGYRVNVTGTGLLLLAKNIDQPGIIGKVGTILGEHGINIAFMQVGRKVSGGRAMMVIGVDNHVNDEVLAKLSKVETISDIHLVEW
jgi:D-3-phosphoglycerate dehydrogenase